MKMKRVMREKGFSPQYLAITGGSVETSDKPFSKKAAQHASENILICNPLISNFQEKRKPLPQLSRDAPSLAMPEKKRPFQGLPVADYSGSLI
jgi:hypothetical protein